MNERIETLMYQSGLTAQGCWDSMDSYDQQSILKFAQLIVKECASIVGYHYTRDVCVSPHLIKKHFGVED